MQPKHFLKAGLLTVVLLLLFFTSWELYLRNKGIRISYDDGPPLWSDKRARVYQPSDQATVFIGSSRIKYDLDIPTWKKLTGEDAVQLAMEGSSPLPVLDDLAADKEFKGKLVIDVTEGLFFTTNPPNLEDPLERIKYYKKRTPSERASFVVNHALESQFVFLDKNELSLNAFANKLQIPSRAGVFIFPTFPMEFNRSTFERQSKMTDEFVADTNLHRKVTDIWNFFRSLNHEPPASGAKLDSFFNVVKKDCDLIRTRGGQVIFVRTPSSGPYWMGEQHGFPRNNYWDKLIAYVKADGIYFTDYPAIAHFTCPEWSHLKPSDGVIYTTVLAKAMQDKGWKFKNTL
jgi:hypothetical protein